MRKLLENPILENALKLIAHIGIIIALAYGFSFALGFITITSIGRQEMEMAAAVASGFAFWTFAKRVADF